MIILRMEYLKNGAAVKVSTEEGAYVLDAGDILQLHLIRGMEVDAKLEQLFYEKAGIYDALCKAMGSLSRVDFSKKGLVRRLKEKKVEEQFAQAAADYVEKAGYLNDHTYAEKLAKYYLEEKGWGEKRALIEMISKGISGELAQEVLDALEYDPRENIRALVKQKYGRLDLNDRKNRKKVCDALYRCGFQYDDISAVLAEIIEGDLE